MDVFGELWQGLGSFDVVLCSGLIYSVPNPMSLLLRLARVTGELLVIESASTTNGGDEPMMLFRGEEDGNPSNWWIPNRACLEQMLATAGFAGDLDGLGGAARGALDAGLRARGAARRRRPRAPAAAQAAADERPRRRPRARPPRAPAEPGGATLNVGIVSKWFNRGQPVVGRYLRSAVDELGHRSFVLAKPRREKGPMGGRARADRRLGPARRHRRLQLRDAARRVRGLGRGELAST